MQMLFFASCIFSLYNVDLDDFMIEFELAAICEIKKSVCLVIYECIPKLRAFISKSFVVSSKACKN
jgi:hypothetical protein